MAIVTISRGSYSKGKEIAEKVAQGLGYPCVAREILLEASETFNIPEIKLVRALHDAPSVLQRFSYGKERYLAYIQAAFLEHIHPDKVVYHGLAGPFLLRGVSHVLKVRIISDLEDRVRLEMEREKIGRDEALHVLKKDDDERRKWSLALYGVDTADPSLYDLVLHIRRITVDDAVDTIVRLAQADHFGMTGESEQAMTDLLTAARVRVKLVDIQPNVKVSSQGGVVYIEAQAPESQEAKLHGQLEKLALQAPGVTEARVRILPIMIYD